MGTYANNITNTNEKYELYVNMNKKTVDVSEMLMGIFFEDINYGADGGLYSQLIENNSFESVDDSLSSWEINTGNGGEAKVKSDRPLNCNNTSYIELKSTKEYKVSITNRGYKGIKVESGKYYDFYLFANNIDNINHVLEVKIIDSNGNLVSDIETITTNNSDWTKYETQIRVKKDIKDAKLCITMMDEGIIDLDMISLFPSANDTWNKRKYGLRKDLVERIQELHPKFLRFPGGCVVEGNNKAEMYNWKNTIGKVEERKQVHNLWGYNQSYGLGFYEYFQLCEDLNMEPIPVVNCGMTCQCRGIDGVPSYSADNEELNQYIQDALDLIEYANGDITTTWGSKRAEAGHSQPFNLKYIAIGNEQWGKDYEAKFERFQEVFRERYPDINLITCVGPTAEGETIEEEWAWAKKRAKNTYVDEHYYMEPEWFKCNTHRYDNYDRTSNKVYLGEYASKSNTLKSALAEGAYLTGIEKNSDIVKMSSYAPLFAKENDNQWAPNMIWFNEDGNYGSANFYMQKLFGDNLGTEMLYDEFKTSGEDKDVFTSSSYDRINKEIILKIVNTSNETKTIEINLEGDKKLESIAKVQYITSEDESDINSFNEPEKVSIKEKTISNISKKFEYNSDKYSATVIRIKAE